MHKNFQYRYCNFQSDFFGVYNFQNNYHVVTLTATFIFQFQTFETLIIIATSEFIFNFHDTF